MKKCRCPCCGRKGWKGTKADYEVLKTILKYAMPIVQQAALQQDWRIPKTGFRQPVTLDEAAARNERLARKSREYDRRYYARNKERIERMRRERAVRRAEIEKQANGGKNVH